MLLQTFHAIVNVTALFAGPSLRLCSCRPRVAMFANRVMLLRTNEEVVFIYVVNYALLLVRHT
jgi:hypothetical protein